MGNFTRLLILMMVLIVGAANAQVTSITTYINQQLPNNTSRQITPANVRNSILSVVNNLSTISYTGAISTTYITTTLISASNIVNNVKLFGAIGDGVADDTAAIQRAIDASANGALYFPGGIYQITTSLTLPTTAPFMMYGDGTTSSQIRPNVSMTSLLYKKAAADGGTEVQLFVKDMYLNARRLADRCMDVGIARAGAIDNVQCRGPLVEGFKFGDDTGASSARFYENKIHHVIVDGNCTFATISSTMPTYGFNFTRTASDNEITAPVVYCVNTAAILNLAGGNTIIAPHAYGLGGVGVSNTGPLYNVIAGAQSSIIAPYSDGIASAGVKVSASNVTIMGGINFWNPSSTPVLGGAVPVEVNTGLSNVNIYGGSSSGANTSNPYIRYLGTTPFSSSMGLVGNIAAASVTAVNSIQVSSPRYPVSQTEWMSTGNMGLGGEGYFIGLNAYFDSGSGVWRTGSANSFPAYIRMGLQSEGEGGDIQFATAQTVTPSAFANAQWGPGRRLVIKRAGDVRISNSLYVGGTGITPTTVLEVAGAISSTILQIPVATAGVTPTGVATGAAAWSTTGGGFVLCGYNGTTWRKYDGTVCTF